MPLELAVRGAEASKADVSRCRRVLCRVATTDSAPTTSAPSERKDKREYVVYFGGNAYSGAEWDEAIQSRRLKPPPSCNATRQRPISIQSIMQFDGPAPEVINGRSAMLGFTAAVCGELYYQESVLNLLQDTPRSVILVFTLIMVGSLFPMGLGIHPQEKAHGIFTAENELWGGRLAMIGFVSLIATEALKGGTALF